MQFHIHKPLLIFETQIIYFLWHLRDIYHSTDSTKKQVLIGLYEQI